MQHRANPGFLDQTIGRLVYAIIPLNIFLTIAHGATSRDIHDERSLWLCVGCLVLLIVFWAISTVRLIARRRRKNRWRLIALTPPTVILVMQSYGLDEPIGFLATAFLVWLGASLSLAFFPDLPQRPAVQSR